MTRIIETISWLQTPKDYFQYSLLKCKYILSQFKLSTNKKKLTKLKSPHKLYWLIKDFFPCKHQAIFEAESNCVSHNNLVQ